MKAVIDRFESGYAVCQLEDGSMMDVKRIRIPKGAEEGTVIEINGDDITIDQEETSKRKQDVKKLAEKLWED